MEMSTKGVKFEKRFLIYHLKAKQWNFHLLLNTIKGGGVIVLVNRVAHKIFWRSMRDGLD